ncbi:MAG: 30S ribosomal protein S17 [Candidatus Babeliales bacterium]
MNNKNTHVAVVISKKMQKTAVVKKQRTFVDPMYGKVIREYKVYKVHDPKDEAKVGDTIEFKIGARVSKTKYAHLVRIIV